MKYLLLLFLLLLPSCAEFETKMEEMNRLTCSPVDSSMCAGWEVEEN
jgi:hypothetical protein